MFKRWFARTRGLSLWSVIGAMTIGLLAACGGSDDDPPAAPTEVVVVGGDAQVTVSWTASGGASSYNVYWSTTSGVTKDTGTKIEKATSPYVQTGLTNGQTYYYIVTAVNGDGESKASAEATVTLAPAAPGTVSATSGDHQVTVDWRDSFGATSYNIYWSNTPGVTKATGTKIEGATAPYVHAGLTNSTTYYYVVTAVNDGGEGLESVQVSTTPMTPAPGAPTDVTAIATPETTKSVTLSWSPVTPSNPAHTLTYNVYRSDTAGINPANAATYDDKFADVASPFVNTVPLGQTAYYYVVTAVEDGVEGPASAEVSATTKGSPSDSGGDTGYGNNLSVPVVFADGIGITGGTITGTDYTDLATGLRPTATDVTDPFPYFNEADVFTKTVSGVATDYYKQQTSSTWQASWLNGKGTTQYVELDWGDNLGSASLSSSQTIRVETVLRQYPGGTSWPAEEAMNAYPMALLYGTGKAEMQGTTGETVPATERRVYTVTARLQILKLVDGVPTEHVCGFSGTVADGLSVPDGSGSSVAKYGGEINVGGSQTYGFNWRLSQCAASDKAGAWRMVFSFDDGVMVGGTPVTNNTQIESLHSSETKAVLVDAKTSYIDITVK